MSVPVGKATLGRVFNLVGEPIDGRGPVAADDRWAIHRESPEVTDGEVPELAIAPVPTSVEDAVEQMDLLGHHFYVFQNNDSGQINVVYRRKDENYGLIVPEPAESD